MKNCYPFKGYIWNYGALPQVGTEALSLVTYLTRPQTWEDPSFTHPETKHKGDNDPVDALEIGSEIAYPGQVKQVKPLGIMALIDSGETDWKVIVIDVTDPKAEKLNNVQDVEKEFPGLLDGTRRWFRTYKVPDGKAENKWALDGEARNTE